MSHLNIQRAEESHSVTAEQPDQGPGSSVRGPPSAATAMMRTWVFTINNPTPEDDPSKWPDVSYLVYQHEVGSEGTPHYQGYVQFTKNKRLSGAKKINGRAHWSPARGTGEQNKHYCSKPVQDCSCVHCKDLDPAMRLAGPFEWGIMPMQGRRTDIEHLKDDVKEGKPLKEIVDVHTPLFLKYPTAVKEMRRIFTPDRNHATQLVVFYGAPGTGKTTEALTRWPDAFWLPTYGKSTVWWDGYDNHQTVIIDEFRGQVDPAMFCSLIDRTPFQVNIKGTTAKFVAKLVVVISNFHPHQWWGPEVELQGVHRRLAEAAELKEFAQRVPRLTINPANIDPFPASKGKKRTYGDIRSLDDEPDRSGHGAQQTAVSRVGVSIRDTVVTDHGVRASHYIPVSEPQQTPLGVCVSEGCYNPVQDSSKSVCVHHNPDLAHLTRPYSDYEIQVTEDQERRPGLGPFYGAQR